MGAPESHNSQPLKVLVAGAGIGGLTAALALRRQGHDVTICERSKLLKEYGAAISMAPNASAVLRRLGVRLEDHGGVEWHGAVQYDGDQKVGVYDQTKERSHGAVPHHMILRRDLHIALIEAATGDAGDGKPALLRTGCPIVAADPDAGTVTTKDGETLHGDVVIAADGVHSPLRNFIKGNEGVHSYPHPNSIFRLLIPSAKIEADPATAHFEQYKNYFSMFQKQGVGEGAIIMYHGASGTVTNVAALCKTEAAKPDSSDYHATGSKERMLELFSGLGPGVTALLSHADPDAVGLWQLRDMDQLPSWVQGRLALLGDAAHPFLPFLGQGGAMAIEDGGTIGALFPAGTAPADVPARLAMYQTLRYERASFVQEQTRVQGRRAFGSPLFNPGSAESSSIFMKMSHYLNDYDAWGTAEKAVALGDAESLVTKPPQVS